ncbi:MAG TPA: CCA tRNA nucleotidyltransferase [Rhodospirillaceae bacterium]|jgi:poly(A) polymerase|nr:CCA tRNA nucleotidyltransferase [Alphaproteobacteria bacterium]HBH26798.1 CCA tRNA nucleotidyltransferase [Rhodospirillaceae bacterium]
MQPAFTLATLPTFMTTGTFPARAIEALGGPGAALFVGGCVRNAILGLPVTDVDVATTLLPQEVTQALRRAKIGVVPTGLAHGTVTAVEKGAHVEVTTLRRDVTTDGRRATVAFTQDWSEDAARRDFTMNTLLAAPDGRVFEPLGGGLADARAGRVVFVGDPARRIAEDRLRVLRFFRMHALYGRGEPDAQALAACREAAEALDSLSRERVTAEVIKILEGAADPGTAAARMWSCGVLTALCGGAGASALLTRLTTLQTQHAAPSLPARLYAMAGGTRALEAHLRLPKAALRAVAVLERCAHGPAISTPRAARAATYRHGREAAVQIALVQSAAGRVPPDALLAVLDSAQHWPIPRFPLTGHDLIAQGVPPGPALGRALTEAEAAWVDGDFGAL